MVVLAGCNMQTHDQLRLAIVADGGAQHDPRRGFNARSCRRGKAWFSSIPPAPVEHQCFEIHANFVLGSDLVRSKIDDTRFRAANKERLEIMIVEVSDVRVDVGMA